MPITVIITSGETGADQGALRAAKALGLKTGGHAPTGYKTEDGPAPWLEALFGLVDTKDYGEMNALVADALLIIGVRSIGANHAENYFTAEGKPTLWLNEYQAMNADARLRLWVARNNISTLCISGNRERRSPGIGGAVERFLLEVLPKCR